jgi:LacI family transcriptional regulator
MQGHWLAMRDAGVEVADELCLAVPLRPEAGAEAVDRLLALPARRRPTAVLVANHEASYGALPALQERDVRIPAELSVICYEDSQLARWWHPAITVVDNNAAQMGELASRLLLEQLERDAPAAAQAQAQAREFRVGSRLVERASCRSLRRTKGETQSFHR